MTMLVSIRAVWLLSVLFAYAAARSLGDNFHEKATHREKNETSGTKLREDIHISTTGMKKPEIKSSHVRKRDANQGHEDLLELMVRIAETPEEWDRIHRILNELGKDEKKKSGVNLGVAGANNALTNKGDENIKDHTSLNTIKLNITHDVATHVSEVGDKQQQADATASTYKSINKHKHKATAESYETSSDDSWPDFDEAIWNKKRWRLLPKIKDDDENSFSENWLETEYSSKQHLRHSKYEALDRQEQAGQSTDKFLQNNAESNEVSDSLDDTWDYNNDINDNKDSEVWKDSYGSSVKDDSTLIVQTEGTRQEVKNVTQNVSVIAENVTNTWNPLNSNSNKSRSNRPNFTFHRVTSSPRERHKANAYIAVSVVKESKTAPQPSPTRAPTEAPWNHARHLHRLQEQLKSISAVKAKLRHHWLDKEYQHAHMSRGHYGNQQSLQNRTHH